MISKDKSLKTNDSFFRRVINFFKKLFKKDTNSNIEVANISVKDDFSQNQETQEEKVAIYPDMFDEEGMPKAEYLPIILEKIEQDLQNNQEQKVVINKTEEEKTEEARRFFEIYNEVKNEEIDPKDVDPIDLIKINRMLKEEIKIHKNKYNL